MATVSISKGIQVGGAVNVYVGGASGTLYTVPANSYLNIWYFHVFGQTYGSNPTQATGYVNGVAIISGNGNATLLSTNGGFIVGPGAVISYDGSGGPFSYGQLQATLFTNVS